MLRHIARRILFATAVLAAPLMAESFVILHTNDTHSNIDSDSKGVGGILPRKAIIDSVRNAEPDVLLIDAGDMVQGTLYFKYFRGDVEYPLFNMMGYDVRILGNHEFDNGLDELARQWQDVKGARLSANYDFTGTPAEGIFSPYVIREIGGKRVGIMGINIDPSSLISQDNVAGVGFKDPVVTANEVAAKLKREGCDIVVAVTHIGYESENGKPADPDLARLSHDIDIIIGGHSHTTVDPNAAAPLQSRFANADGREVVVAQTGKYGRNIGRIEVEINDDGTKRIDYSLIPVTDRFDSTKYDREIIDFLKPYKNAVDSVNSVPIGTCLVDMDNYRKAGAFGNWVGDYAAQKGRAIVDSLNRVGASIRGVDLGLMNVGGIRQPMPAGAVTEGQILATFPFSNHLVIVGVKGSDLIETMRVAAAKGGEAVSSDIMVISNAAGEVEHVLIDGEEVDPEREYIVTTIDYVAEGNDDMTPMANHRPIWRDSEEVSVRMLEYVKRLTALGLEIDPDVRPRFVVTK